MPKIKKIKKIPSKIKEINPKPSTSGLEKEVERTAAQKEVDSFVEFVSGATGNISSGGLEQGSARTQVQLAQPATEGEEQTAETGQERVSYEGVNAQSTYTTAGGTGSRQREGIAYNPTIRQTAPTDLQTTPANLADRSITGRQFIGQEQPPGGRELEGRDEKKDYKAAHEGR